MILMKIDLISDDCYDAVGNNIAYIFVNLPWLL